MESICDEAFNNIFGSTDSELLFAIFIDEILRGGQRGNNSTRMARAMDRTIVRVIEAVRQHGNRAPSYLNCAVADGDHAVVTRFTDDHRHPPESLYHFLGDLYPRAEIDQAGEVNAEERSMIVSSERLTSDPAWEPLPPNYMTILKRNSKPELRPCTIGSQISN